MINILLTGLGVGRLIFLPTLLFCPCAGEESTDFDCFFFCSRPESERAPVATSALLLLWWVSLEKKLKGLTLPPPKDPLRSVCVYVRAHVCVVLISSVNTSNVEYMYMHVEIIAVKVHELAYPVTYNIKLLWILCYTCTSNDCDFYQALYLPLAKVISTAHARHMIPTRWLIHAVDKMIDSAQIYNHFSNNTKQWAQNYMYTCINTFWTISLNTVLAGHPL